jgi:hypothetical protein
MNLFNKKPKLRLLFFTEYIIVVIWIFKNVQPFNLALLCSLIMIFGSYISLVKAGIFSDKNVDSISDFNFDFISLLIIIILAINTFS